MRDTVFDTHGRIASCDDSFNEQFFFEFLVKTRYWGKTRISNARILKIKKNKCSEMVISKLILKNQIKAISNFWKKKVRNLN